MRVRALVTIASLAKTAEPIEISFGQQTACTQGTIGVHIATTGRIRWIDRCGGGDASLRLATITVATCLKLKSTVVVVIIVRHWCIRDERWAGIIGKSGLADELAVRAVSHADSLLTTSDGRLQLTFHVDSDDVELVCELNCNGGDSACLADCVSRSVDGRTTSFSVGLPAAGEYALNVFARRRNDPTRLHHVHTYLVTSTQQPASNDHDLTTLGTVIHLTVLRAISKHSYLYPHR